MLLGSCAKPRYPIEVMTHALASGTQQTRRPDPVQAPAAEPAQPARPRSRPVPSLPSRTQPDAGPDPVQTPAAEPARPGAGPIRFSLGNVNTSASRGGSSG